jgi:hypothetical protein
MDGYPPKPTVSELIADSRTTSAIASVNSMIAARLALSARTRYKTSGRERLLPMAGFEVSTYGRF